MKVSIIIPVFNKLAYTRQCVDRILRYADDGPPFEIVVVDNASTDGTAAWSTGMAGSIRYLRHETNLGFSKANNAGARASTGDYLLFLNNDTLVQPGWLNAMVRLAETDAAIGIVGMKQLFPYTNLVYHTGVVFAAGGVPRHLYPHLDGSLPHVNQAREYQAVNGACLLIGRSLFDECGGFDEAFVNGYEDTDLCMKARQRGRKIVCCTGAYIYHYGQTSEGRTAADDRNAALFASRWSSVVRIDQDDYLLKDRVAFGAVSAGASTPARMRSLPDDCIYFADDLNHASAFTWVTVELVEALTRLGAPVMTSSRGISPTVPTATRRALERLAVDAPVGGVQMKFAHYWPRHFHLELNGAVNLEMFVTNYRFSGSNSEPWDPWTQSLRQNHRMKLPVSEFCAGVLGQIGVPEGECRVLHHGYSNEIRDVEAPKRRGTAFRILTVTNSHDLERYGTMTALEAYDQAFTAKDEVTLVIKDYGSGAGDTTIRDWMRRRTGRANVEYVADFTEKRDLIRLYKSCDAFLSTHRGEGFGMKILDAMACGLPVVTTFFGGPTAYCTSSNCFPVEHTMVPVSGGIDARSLKLTNGPVWAEPTLPSVVQQLRKVYENRDTARAVGEAGRVSVIESYSWDAVGKRLIQIAREAREKKDAREARRQPARPRAAAAQANGERSPYWFGVRVSVVIPTYNRREKLLATLGALARQSILPQEFEVIVVDDGSTDATGEAIEAQKYPFALRYFRQENAGPGAARNRGIDEAHGEIVLFIGDDILAGERLLEEHLLAHAARSEPGAAVLGHLDWVANGGPDPVMDYIAGEATEQFAYNLLPKLSRIDHRFFYTSNISLKRQFLVDAADAAVRFDADFRRAAFEDAEFALRLMPRGLDMRYVPAARAMHDHAMDMDSFARREFGAGEMAVVFYRKHPGQDDLLRVGWLADLVAPAAALAAQPDLLRKLEEFDADSDAQLRAVASREALRVIFDVERTRGRLKEWYSNVQDPSKVRVAQTLGSVMRKLEFFKLNAGDFGLAGPVGPVGVVQPALSISSELGAQIQSLDGVATSEMGRRLAAGPSELALRRLVAKSSVLPRLLAFDRFVQARLHDVAPASWTDRYLQMRTRLRRLLR